MKRLSSILLIVLLLTGLSYSQATIDEINVDGLNNLDKDFFVSILNQKKGDSFSPVKLRDDIRNLYELGYFENIDVDVNETSTGIVIHFEVKERPFIYEINIKGNKQFSKNEILEEAPFLTEDVPFDKKYIHKAEYRIKKKYQEKGYASIKVKTSHTLKEDKGIIINFNIEEGTKISVGDIVFKGIDKVDPDELRKAMETKESRWWKHPKLDKTQLKEDMERIKKKLNELGYFGYEIRGHEVKIDDKRKRADIYIDLKEGKRYILDEIEVKGNEIFADKEILENITLEKGEYFDGEEWSKTQQNIINMYGNKSHIFANIDPIYNFDGDKLNLKLIINEGNPIKIGNINIEGNTKTFDKVILRNLLLKPGDKFQRNKLMLSQRQLYNTGYFKDLKIIPSPHKGREDKMDLTISLKEQRTGSINFGGTYNAVTGFAIYLKYEEKNIFGRGIKGNIQIDYGKNKKTYMLGLTDPYFRDTPTYVSFNVYRKLNIYDEYDIFRNGGDITLGRNLSLFTKGFISYKYERVDLENVIEEAQEDIDEASEIRSSATISFERDSRDNKFEPTTGTFNSISAELGGTILGGDLNYHKYEAETNWFFKSFWKLVFSNNLKVGVVEKLEPSSKVPQYERFFVGGNVYGVRGYEDKELSPEDENGYITGGNFYVTNSVTYKAPLVENRVTGYLFWDVGKAWENIGDFNFRDMRDGAGLGVKVTTPMGPLTLEYAYGFENKNWKFHFGIFQGDF